MKTSEAAHWAGLVDEARRNGALLDQLITEQTPLSMDDAYAIQDQLTEIRCRRGERWVGWKLGYTSAAMRAQMGVVEANVGPLTDAMILSDGADIADVLVQPRVEPEIAVVIGRALTSRPTIAEVHSAIIAAHACLEVVDSVWTAYRFRIEDNTADGSSGGRVVLGPRLDLRRRLPTAAVLLERNGRLVATATAAAASGSPLEAIAWLTRWLAGRGRQLSPGSLVITGGLTAAVPLELDDVVCATFADGSDSISVTVRRTTNRMLGETCRSYR